MLRANWDNRHLLLAVAKWGDSLALQLPHSSEITRVRSSGRDEQHFIEAHIWGAFTSTVFEHVVIHLPLQPYDDAGSRRVDSSNRVATNAFL